MSVISTVTGPLAGSRPRRVSARAARARAAAHAPVAVGPAAGAAGAPATGSVAVGATGQPATPLWPLLVLGGSCAAVGVVAAVSPSRAALAIVLVALLGAMLWRVEWAALAYVAVEPFGDLLRVVHGESVKLVAALLFAAWALRLLVRVRPLAVAHPATYAALGLALCLLASTAWHPNGAAGLEVVVRYLPYLAALVVLVDLMRTTLSPRRVVLVYVVSCTAAAGVGLVDYLGGGAGRAGGPLEDPNDFAFFLVTALPFVLVWARGAGTRLLAVVAGVVLVLTVALTFSRGALLALTVMVALALATRLLRVREVAVTAGALAGAAALVLLLAPGLVSQSLESKQHVADDNVDSRFTTWTMAARMTADRPLLGQGPGGFGTQAHAYVPVGVADTSHVTVPHQMYLDIASELGLLGLAAFLVMVGASLAGAARAARDPGADRPLARAVCVALGGALVAACFLSEHYYLPIWLLVAVGVALDPRSGHRPPDRRGGEPCASSS